MGGMGWHGPNKNPPYHAWAEPSARGSARHGPHFIRAVPGLALRHEHDTNKPQPRPARPDLQDY
jgi:hypothetical protein